jgi:flavin reductase (DIM6/NTAB) family NADH-FMN oxidoreductase RutF
MALVDISFPDFVKKTIELHADLPRLLVTVSSQGRPNVMTVGGTHYGIGWVKPFVYQWVRPSCYTSELIEETGEYTLNIPREGMEDVVRFCGSVSGRDRDKFAEMNLTAIPSRFVSAPVIKECGIHLECKLMGIFDVRPESVSGALMDYYETGNIPEHNYHRLYPAEIVAAYADEDIARCLW